MKKIYFVFILMICFITNSKAQNTCLLYTSSCYYFQMIFFPFVIGIQKCNILKTCFFNPPVSCSRYTSVLLVDEADEWIVHSFDDRNTPVGSTIVDNNYLKMLKRLGENRIDCSFYVSFFII